ncbi:hypothetical protein [Bacillus sp. FJAT-42376]|nr:hypothetical protein [Bacillus sp. FJAT-42376]
MKRKQDESYIANKGIEEAFKNDSKVSDFERINVESAPILIDDEPENKQL